jgi:hypothetical protein
MQFHLFTYHRGPLAEWFATHHSDYVKVAGSSFLQNRGELFPTLGIIEAEIYKPNTSILLIVILRQHLLTRVTDSEWEYGLERNVLFK